MYDPFLGGGTTIVESLASGRRCVGVDINPLAVFVARSKITSLTAADEDSILAWAECLQKINLRTPCELDSDWTEYCKNVPWWLARTIALALMEASKLRTTSAQQFARATLLKTAQWALDLRTRIPGKREFLKKHSEDVAFMIDMSRRFRAKVKAAFRGSVRDAISRNARILGGSAADIDLSHITNDWGHPDVVITSPPYWGLHILYHRWQVQGRRETAAAFWLANKRDGMGPSHYTLASRHRDDELYLLNAFECFSNIASVLKENGVVVQLVGFANARRQLPAYLAALAAAGLREDRSMAKHAARRIARAVPSRKWYVDANTSTRTREYLLIHHR